LAIGSAFWLIKGEGLSKKKGCFRYVVSLLFFREKAGKEGGGERAGLILGHL